MIPRRSWLAHALFRQGKYTDLLFRGIRSQVSITDPVVITILTFSPLSAMRADPLRESISLELDVINIFVRMVQILAMQQNRKK